MDLHIDCSGGSTGASLALMDVIDLLGVTVRAWCTGQAVGPAVGVLAVGHHRTMSAHARLHLTEPSVEFEGSARHLEQMAEAHAMQWAMFCDRLAEATGQTGRPDRGGHRSGTVPDGVGGRGLRRRWTPWPRPTAASSRSAVHPSASGPAE